MKNKLILFSAFGICFALAVLIRFDQITSKIGCNEQTYILTLQTVEIWKSEGFSKHFFTPVWTYPNEGDKHFAYYKRLENNEGNNYYVSFPPLAFWLAHALLFPFDIENGKLILQLLNILLHFISALLVYLIISNLFVKKHSSLHFPAFMAFVVYLFMPATLYLHTDIFFPEMLAQVFWIAAIYFGMKLLSKNIIKNKNQNFFSFIIIFFFLYSEWIAFFFTLTFFLIILFKKVYLKKHLLLLTIISTTVFTLIIIQYASIAGIEKLAQSMGIRFLERSGFFGEKYSSMGVNIFSFSSILFFFKNLHKALVGFGYFVLFLFLGMLLYKFKTFGTHLKKHKLLLLLSTTPLILHFIIFFNANALHLILLARIAVPISILMGLTTYFLTKNVHSKYLLGLLVFIVFIFSAFYYRNNLTQTINNEHTDKLALFIANESKPDEAVMVITDFPCVEAEKYLTFKSKRNVIRINRLEEAQILLLKNNKTKGIVFSVDEHKNYDIIRVSI